MWVCVPYSSSPPLWMLSAPFTQAKFICLCRGLKWSRRRSRRGRGWGLKSAFINRQLLWFFFHYGVLMKKLSCSLPKVSPLAQLAASSAGHTGLSWCSLHFSPRRVRTASRPSRTPTPTSHSSTFLKFQDRSTVRAKTCCSKSVVKSWQMSKVWKKDKGGRKCRLHLNHLWNHLEFKLYIWYKRGTFYMCENHSDNQVRAWSSSALLLILNTYQCSNMLFSSSHIQSFTALLGNFVHIWFFDTCKDINSAWL